MQNCSDIAFFGAGKIFWKIGIYFTSRLSVYQQVIAFGRFVDTASPGKIAFDAFHIYLHITACLHNIRLNTIEFCSRAFRFRENTPSLRENAPSFRENTPSHRENSPSHRENAPSRWENSPSHRENSPSRWENSPSHRENSPGIWGVPLKYLNYLLCLILNFYKKWVKTTSREVTGVF
jgi:hypothetical protein